MRNLSRETRHAFSGCLMAIDSLKTLFMRQWQRWANQSLFSGCLRAPLPTAPPKSYPPRQSPPHRATRRCQTKPTRARGDCRAACRCAAPRRFPAIARTNACCLKRECCRFAIGCDGLPASCAKPFGVFRPRGAQSAACGCRDCRDR